MPIHRTAMSASRIAGEHSGIELFTVGQSARIGGASAKWFVVDKTSGSGDVLVAKGSDHPRLWFRGLKVRCHARLYGVLCECVCVCVCECVCV